MTKDEQKTIDTLLQSIRDLRTENAKFREDVKLQIDTINTKTEKKHLPITLEQDIVKVAQQSISKAIQDSITGYNSPLVTLTKTIVESHSQELSKIIDDSFVQVIRTEDFKQSIVTAFSHKVAKTIISNNDGLFDKVSNDLKQDVIFKSKMQLAVSNVVEECLKEKKGKI